MTSKTPSPSGSMTIQKVELTDSAQLLTAEVVVDGTPRQLHFRSSSAPLTNSGDVWFTNLLIAAMTQGGDFVVNGEVSRRLLASAETIMDIGTKWWPTLQRVRIRDATPVDRQPTLVGRVGAFFSAGVDSFYTLLQHQDEIDDLILMNGFDMPPGRQELWNQLSQAVDRVAAAFGKQVVKIQTDCRPFHDDLGVLSKVQSAMLASSAMAFGQRFRKVYIPSSFGYAWLQPCGSHPLVDPLWSTEAIEFVHDGCEANRFQKVELLSTCEAALQNVRPCFYWQNPQPEYNCCICEKCLRTMGMLAACGALERCSAFPKPISLRRYARLRLTSVTRDFHRQTLAALIERRRLPTLQRAIRWALKQPNPLLDILATAGEPGELLAGGGRIARQRLGALFSGNIKEAFKSWS